MIAEAEAEDEKTRRKKRGLLKLYYGMSDQSVPGQAQDPYDINEAHFQHFEFLEKLFKEKSLSELMDKETEIVKRESKNLILEILGLSTVGY